jgi:hypothetical protein
LRVSASILIQRSITEVFAFMSTPSYLPAWVEGVAAVDGPASPDQEIGETLAVRGSSSLGLVWSTWEVTNYEPPRTLALRCLDDRHAIEARWTLEGCRAGATRISVEADITAVGFFPLASVQLKELGTRQLQADLDVLRRHLEADALSDSR